MREIIIKYDNRNVKYQQNNKSVMKEMKAQ